MKIHTLSQEQSLPISCDEAWAFFSAPGNLNEITPTEIGFKCITKTDVGLHEGQILIYRIGVLPLIWVTWVTEIKAVEMGVSFIDEQRFGPYKFWHHRHCFEEIAGGVRMRDFVHYGLGFGPIGAMAHALFVRRKLERIFKYRRTVLENRFGKM